MKESNLRQRCVKPLYYHYTNRANILDTVESDHVYWFIRPAPKTVENMSSKSGVRETRTLNTFRYNGFQDRPTTNYHITPKCSQVWRTRTFGDFLLPKQVPSPLGQYLKLCNSLAGRNWTFTPGIQGPHATITPQPDNKKGLSEVIRKTLNQTLVM